MPIKFKELVRHDGLQLGAGVSTAFEDERAEEYFIAAGWAEATTDAPQVTYPKGSLRIDQSTIFTDGTIVLQPADVNANAGA